MTVSLYPPPSPSFPSLSSTSPLLSSPSPLLSSPSPLLSSPLLSLPSPLPPLPFQPVEVHELNANFFEGSLCQQVSFDPREGLMGIVICLLYQTQLFTLRLVQTTLHTVGQKGPDITTSTVSI